VVQFTARYQPPEASETAKAASEGEPSDADLDASAEKDFLLVLEHAPKVEVRICSASSVTVTDPQLDHYIIYHCHFELGKLYAARGDFAKAGKNFDIVMSGKLRNDHAETNADEQVKSQRANRTRKHRANTRLRELYYSKHTQRSRNSERRKRASSLRPHRGFVHAYT
jgi:hypothetical protein